MSEATQFFGVCPRGLGDPDDNMPGAKEQCFWFQFGFIYGGDNEGLWRLPFMEEWIAANDGFMTEGEAARLYAQFPEGVQAQFPLHVLLPDHVDDSGNFLGSFPAVNHQTMHLWYQHTDFFQENNLGAMIFDILGAFLFGWWDQLEGDWEIFRSYYIGGGDYDWENWDFDAFCSPEAGNWLQCFLFWKTYYQHEAPEGHWFEEIYNKWYRGEYLPQKTDWYQNWIDAGRPNKPDKPGSQVPVSENPPISELVSPKMINRLMILAGIEEN
jgi:hypothetical protein